MCRKWIRPLLVVRPFKKRLKLTICNYFLHKVWCQSVLTKHKTILFVTEHSLMGIEQYFQAEMLTTIKCFELASVISKYLQYLAVLESL